MGAETSDQSERLPGCVSENSYHGCEFSTSRGVWFFCLAGADACASKRVEFSTEIAGMSGWAARKKWLACALRCRLEPMRKVAKSIRSHLWGILDAILHRVTSSKAEAINSRIQWLKKRACGYRNRQRFRNAIYFHQGGLDLPPRPRAAHTTS